MPRRTRSVPSSPRRSGRLPVRGAAAGDRDSPARARARPTGGSITHKLLVGLALGAVVLAHYGLRGYGSRARRRHGRLRPRVADAVRPWLGHAVLEEYAPFMVLLFSLYVISGGLQLSGDLVARPAVNTAFLGARGASWPA